MKAIIIGLVVIVSFQNLFSQNDSIPQQRNTSHGNIYTDYMETVEVSLGFGVFVPQGKLREYFGLAPMAELKANFPLGETKSIDGVMQFIVPDQQDDFLFLRTIDTVQAKSTFMFNIFARFKKRVRASEKSEVYLGLGIGGSTILTDARNPFYSGAEGENKYEYISSLLIMPGLEWQHEFSEHAVFTFSLDVQYSPYKVEGALREDIGGFAIIPKISYRF